jgi:predicted aspartyl protease
MSLKTLISLSILLSRVPVATRQQQPARIPTAVREQQLGLVPNLPPLKIEANKSKLIVVPGIVNGSRPVNMLIDTGATCSIVSPRLAKSLRLRALRKYVEVIAGDRTLRSPLVTLPSIELGPIRRPLSCPVADLPLPDVDLLIGWDVLRHVAFTVDFENWSLLWGPGEPLEFRVPFDSSRKQIIVPLKVGTRDIFVLLDSGADSLYLFEEEVSSWLRIEPDQPQKRIGYLSNEKRGSSVRLSRVALGGEVFERMSAVVLESVLSSESHAPDWQGLMGMAALNAKRVQFDFSNGLFSWER